MIAVSPGVLLPVYLWVRVHAIVLLESNSTLVHISQISHIG